MAPKVAAAASRATARTRGVSYSPKSGGAASKKDASGLKHGVGSKSGKRAKVKKVNAKHKKQYKVQIKKWLKTPADWARFDAWAKINAQPRKYPEPEPIIRPSKPLHLLIKRINLLTELPQRTDPRVHCKAVETPVTKAALNAILSKRLLKLSLPRLRLADYGRSLPVTINKATLCYLASKRILCLSQPRIYEREECKPIGIPSGGNNKRCNRRRLLELVKKLAGCPEGLSDEEREELFTAAGIRRTALEYKITPWMEFLAVPWYKNINPEHKDAKVWKRMLLFDPEVRGKKALEEQKKRKEKKKGKPKKEKEKDKSDGEGDGTKTVDGEKEESKNENEEDAKKREEADKKRKRAKNAWRFAPLPYKSYSEAFLVKKSALQKEASPRTIKLAEVKPRKDLTTKRNPFKVKKGALSATSSDRITKLAAPKKPLSPVEKVPPREKDKYGRPIFPKPKYGKILPKTKPYKMGECPKKEEENKETKEKKQRPIDPIVYEPTIDPCIYPVLARKQKRERQRAEKILTEKHEQRKARQDNKTGDIQEDRKDIEDPKKDEVKTEVQETIEGEEN